MNRLPPFRAPFAVRSPADVRRLEETPLDAALPVRSTYEIFCNSAAAFGAKPALTFLPTADPAAAAVRWSYADLLAGIHQTANLLHRIGLGPRDAVAVLLPACLEYHLLLWGGEAAGIVQPLNPLLSDDALASMMQAVRTKVLVAYGAEGDSEYLSKALRLRGRVPSLQALVVVEPQANDAAAPLPANAVPFSQRHAEPSDRLVSGREIAPDDIAAYFHTGGTTGSPKLAQHSHRNQVYTAWASVMLQGVGPDDVAINGFPLFHVAGVLPGSLAALSAGVEMVIPTTGLFRNREVITHYWRLVERHRATVLSGVPTVLAALANVPVDADISTLRYCRTGAAPLAPDLAVRFERHTGLHVHESLGMTEMAGISTITPPGVTAPVGCVGLRLPHSQLRIAALDGDSTQAPRVLEAGQRGMVQFKAPNVMPGFVDPRDDANAFTADGWLASGDIGWLDEQGLLHLAGRSKDLIIRGGHNIDPRAIEDALGAHPAVQLCAAVGAPDAYAGELPVAYATLRPGMAATEAELLTFAAARVDEAPAKPKSVTIVERMPVTNVGKIYKPELRAMAAAAVVRVAAESVCRARGTPVPAVEVETERVVLRLTDGTDAGTEAALRQALASLPCKVDLLRRP
jgi:fatty-acyl-CoA synthase